MAEEMASKTADVASALSDNIHDTDITKYLIFRSGGLLYGVDADCVNEILNETSVTPVPTVPMHVSGVVNLRGQIVPIIDFRLLLGREPGENYCTIVLEIEETQIGILVDGVDRMVDIAKSAILPMPAQQTQKLISGMCTVPGAQSTMMVLDCSLLLHG